MTINDFIKWAKKRGGSHISYRTLRIGETKPRTNEIIHEVRVGGMFIRFNQKGIGRINGNPFDVTKVNYASPKDALLAMIHPEGYILF